MINVLALSSSRVGNGGYLEAASSFIQQALGTKSIKVAFVPFASIDEDYDDYTAMVKTGLAHLPYQIATVQEASVKEDISNADCIMVGGGNTFKLLNTLYTTGAFDMIKEKVLSGVPYVGWSAGANITGLSIRTTNDMPIIQPPTFDAFGFLPFQINPHYINQQWEGFHGETRDQRLMEFLKVDTQTPVVALPEGTALWLQQNVLQYVGANPGVLFKMDNGKPVTEAIEPQKDLSYLLQ